MDVLIVGVILVVGVIVLFFGWCCLPPQHSYMPVRGDGTVMGRE